MTLPVLCTFGPFPGMDINSWLLRLPSHPKPARLSPVISSVLHEGE